MQIKNKIYIQSRAYIIFFSSVLFINIFFAQPINANTFKISDIEITEPFELNFNREKVIDKGFKRAFIQLISTIVNSSDKKKIENTSLQTIKTLIDSFTISDERFVNNEYQSIFKVNFNKKNTLNFLEKKNIFPSIPIKKTLLLIPVLVDLQEDKIFIFNDNIFYKNWNNKNENYFLINYLLPSEDIDDLNTISENISNIEDYNFKNIIKKYDIKDFIVAIFFKNNEKINILSKINFNNLQKINNKQFLNVSLQSNNDVEKLLLDLKITYENYWKKLNQINTSIKLPITISIESSNFKKIQNFENALLKMDLMSNYKISKFNNEKIYFKIIYNGSPKRFLEDMSINKISIDTQNQIWSVI
tara:strand:+ start:617 stop:1696 length:1080 start_codon:yes stop_codon:yes gene_type:complete